MRAMEKDTHFLTFAVEQSQPAAPGPVRFRGIAYSGGLIPQYGWYGDAVIDLASVNLPEQIFALVDHDTTQRAGKCTPRLEAGQIIVEGELFDATDAGREVSALLKAGAPWQMSVGIQAKAKTTDDKSNVTVNGQNLSINTVFSGASLREVSFVPVGADPNTDVSAFAKRDGHPNPKEQNPMELEALKAKVAELEAANAEQTSRAEQAEQALHAIKMAARNTAIAALEQSTGQTFDDTRKAAFAAMDDAGFEAVSVTLSAVIGQKPNLPDHLFSEQATNGKGDADEANALIKAQAIIRNQVSGKV